MTNQDNIGEGQSTVAQAAGRNLRVFVISSRGEPLMPTYPRKARVLIKQGKAKVVQRTPFTIQLLGPSGGNVQPVSLGVDAGTKHIGLSATTSKQVLFEAEVSLRTDIQDLLAGRRELRRARRGRKTRYRQARFLNRKNRKGKLPPSVQNKVDVHVKAVEKVYKFLPVTALVVETAQFDLQKISNPSIEGEEYQHGPQLGFENVKAYVLFRDEHKCQRCKGKSKDKYLRVHHIESRKTGGDSPGNLITLCLTCHDIVHREGLTKEFKRKPSLRDASQMTTMRKFVLKALKKLHPEVQETYGYITKYVRTNQHMVKSHTVDARCVSGNPLAAATETFLIKQVRSQNRQLHKVNTVKGGSRKANKAARYVLGFQLFDKVVFKGQEYFIFGRRLRGSFDLRVLGDTKISIGASYKNLRLVEKASALLTQKCGMISTCVRK